MHRTRRSRKLLILSVGMLIAPRSAAAAEGLTLSPDLGQLAILVVVFAALVYPVNAWLIRPLLRVLEEREQRIEGARTRAGRLAEQAEQCLTRYRADVEAARAEAERQRRALVEEARSEQAALSRSVRAETERQIEAARAEVETALQDARSSLRSEAEILARQVVERILGRPVA